MAHSPSTALGCFKKRPAELRIMIYSYALPSSEPLELGRPTNSISPALLRTSKSIYTEARPLFYSENTFAIDLASENSALLQRLTTTIGAEDCKDIEKLDLTAGLSASIRNDANVVHTARDRWLRQVEVGHETWEEMFDQMVEEYRAVCEGAVTVLMDAGFRPTSLTCRDPDFKRMAMYT